MTGLRDIPGATVALSDGPSDVQPSSHKFVHLALHPGPKASGSGSGGGGGGSGGGNRDLYGDAVDHGSPLKVTVVNPATALAHKLSTGMLPICVNTDKRGILLNPHPLSMEDARHIVESVIQAVGELFAEGWVAPPGHKARL